METKQIPHANGSPALLQLFGSSANEGKMQKLGMLILSNILNQKQSITH